MLDLSHEQALIVANVVFGHAVWVFVEVGEAEHVIFVPHSVALQDAAAGEHGATEVVFGEEVHAGDVVKDAVEMAAGVELCKPSRPFFLEGFELACCSGLANETGLERVRIWHRLCRHVASEGG